MYPARLFSSKTEGSEKNPHHSEEMNKLNARLSKLESSTQANKLAISSLEEKLQEVPTKSEVEATIDPLKELVKENVAALNTRMAGVERGGSDFEVKFKQLLVGLSNAFPFLETKMLQTEEERLLDSSSETDHSESETIRAAKIQARATNRQSWIIFLAFIVALLALVLEYRYHRDTEKDLQFFKEENKLKDELLVKEKERNQEHCNEFDKIVKAHDVETKVLQHEKEKLEYIVQHSFFVCKRELPSESVEKVEENSKKLNH